MGRGEQHVQQALDKGQNSSWGLLGFALCLEGSPAPFCLLVLGCKSSLSMSRLRPWTRHLPSGNFSFPSYEVGSLTL